MKPNNFLSRATIVAIVPFGSVMSEGIMGVVKALLLEICNPKGERVLLFITPMGD